MIPVFAFVLSLAGCFSCPSHDTPTPEAVQPEPPRVVTPIPSPYESWRSFPLTGAEIKAVSGEKHLLVLSHPAGDVEALTRSYVDIAVMNGWKILADPKAGSGGWRLAYPDWEAQAQAAEPGLDATGGLRISGEIVNRRSLITLDYGLDQP